MKHTGILAVLLVALFLDHEDKYTVSEYCHTIQVFIRSISNQPFYVAKTEKNHDENHDVNNITFHDIIQNSVLTFSDKYFLSFKKNDDILRVSKYPEFFLTMKRKHVSFSVHIACDHYL